MFLGGGTPTTLEVADLKALLARVRSVVRRDAGRGGHDRGEPRHGGRAEARRAARSGLRPTVDGRAVVRPLGARGAGARASARVGDEGVPSRARGGLRQREPRPDLRGGGGDDRVVGADARGGDRARRRRTSARTRSRSSRRRRSAARWRAATCRRRIPTSRPTCSRRRAACSAMPGYGHYEVSNWARARVRVPAQPRATGSGGRTSGSARARTATGTAGGRGTSARPRSTCRWSSAASCPVGGSEELEPADAYLEEVFLRLRILQGIPASWVDDGRAEPYLESGLLVPRRGHLVPTERGMLLLNELVLGLTA